MKKKVLVIEDDDFIASLIMGALKRAGFETNLAIDGEGALKKLETEIPDIILLDLILPGIGGFEVLEKIKREDKTKKIPIIILSNLGSHEEIKKGLKSGADAYLVKANILPEDVVKKIEEILR
ncbi:MAG: response regulator [bacterium]|nr:response regulator [bacterium]